MGKLLETVSDGVNLDKIKNFALGKSIYIIIVQHEPRHMPGTNILYFDEERIKTEHREMNCHSCGKDLTDVRPIWSISKEDGPPINYCESCYLKEFKTARGLNEKDWGKEDEV